MVEAIQIQASGVTLTTSGTSARNAIPNNASGKAPNYVRIQVTNYAYVKFGDSAVTATTNDVLLSPNESTEFAISGNTHIAVIQQATAGVVNITPLENV
jgi:hypothetical protein